MRARHVALPSSPSPNRPMRARQLPDPAIPCRRRRRRVRLPRRRLSHVLPPQTLPKPHSGPLAQQSQAVHLQRALQPRPARVVTPQPRPPRRETPPGEGAASVSPRRRLRSRLSSSSRRVHHPRLQPDARVQSTLVRFTGLRFTVYVRSVHCLRHPLRRLERATIPVLIDRSA